MELSKLQEIRHEIDQALTEWRKRTLTNLYRICIGIGFAGLIFVGVSDAMKNPDQYLTMTIYVLLYLVLVFLALKPETDQRVRAWVFISVIYSVAVMALLRGGLAGVGRLFLLSLPILATILIGLNSAYAVSALIVITLLVFTKLASTGLLEPFFYWPLATDPFNTTNWFVETLYSMMVLGIVLSLLAHFYRFLVKTIELERHMMREISQSRSLLREYNQSLEEKVALRTAELAAAVEEAQEARIAAESASRAKSAFLATMSHEIRTPLNAVIGMTSLLMDTSLSVKQSEFAQTIRASGETLLSLINDILDFSKIEAGRMELEQSPLHLRQCIERVIDLIQARAVQKNVEIVYLIDPGVPTAVLGDETRLRQILANLLSNAIKFTDKGEIEISVTASVEEQKTDGESQTQDKRVLITFAIRDTGIGISPANIKKLFQPFNQGDSSTTRRFGGTGLGLAISKRLVEMMNGHIWVESRENEGSTFFFTIKAEPTTSTRRKPPLESSLDLRDKRILIVDDNATNRRILALQFQAWSMQPRVTASANEALQWLKQGQHFDAAVIDMEMAEMDGISLAKEIKLVSQDRSLPIIMLSSLIYEESDRYSDLFSDILTKPIKASNLYNALIAIFAGEVETILRQKTTELAIFDTDMGKRHPLRILVVEDNYINQHLATLMLERMGYLADVAANGLEAIESLQRQAYDAIFMDIQMPELDGLEATRKIRREWNVSEQPRIIAMTANAMSGDREICLAAGMDDYISKPIHISELIGCLNRCLPREVREQEPGKIFKLDPNEPIAGDYPQEEFGGETVSIEDLQRLKESLGAKADQLLLTLLYSYFSQGEKLIYEMRAALQAGEVVKLNRSAHTFKSNSASFGAIRLTEICQRIEEKTRDGICGEEEGWINLAEREFKRVRSDLVSAVHMVLDNHSETGYSV